MLLSKLLVDKIVCYHNLWSLNCIDERIEKYEDHCLDIEKALLIKSRSLLLSANPYRESLIKILNKYMNRPEYVEKIGFSEETRVSIWIKEKELSCIFKIRDPQICKDSGWVQELCEEVEERLDEILGGKVYNFICRNGRRYQIPPKILYERELNKSQIP